MRLLCSGDLHLGAGADLGREPGERLAEQEAVWLSIVKMANELEATILFAGDAWERRRPTPVELLAFRRPLHWLKFPAIIIPGNHDVEAFERPTGYDVFLIDGGRAQLVAKPSVIRTGGAQIACLPWAPAGNLVALEGGGDRDDLNRLLADGLVEIARGLFAQMDPAEPRILLAHWAVGGATTPTGAPTDLFREPVIDQAALEAIGFDAVVLGHIHRPQMLNVAAAPMFYVGSPMPLNFGETGCDHVVWLLDVGDDGNVGAFQIPIESRPLVTIALPADEAIAVAVGDHDFSARTEYAEAIVKVKIQATEEQARRLDVAAIKAEIMAAGAHKVWAIQIERDRAEIVRAELAEDLGDDDAMIRWLEVSGVNGDVAPAVLDLHRSYLAKAAS